MGMKKYIHQKRKVKGKRRKLSNNNNNNKDSR